MKNRGGKGQADIKQMMFDIIQIRDVIGSFVGTEFKKERGKKHRKKRVPKREAEGNKEKNSERGSIYIYFLGDWSGAWEWFFEPSFFWMEFEPWQ